MPVTDETLWRKYDYRVEDNDGSAGAQIVSMVKNKSRVLEIGAGPGSIASVLKEKCGCNISAIEIEPVSIEKLKSFCDAVYCLDLNDENWISAFADIEKFDIIIAADVLEHLLDPWMTLKLAKSLLSQEGQIIVSLPHVGHAAVMACLFNSDFSYQNVGLLDRTHIRFFGIKNIQSLFDDTGLSIEDVGFVVKNPDATELMAQWQILDPNIKQALLRGDYSKVYQIVIKASIEPKSDKSIDLTALTPPAPRITLIQIIIPSVMARRFIKRILKSIIKPEMRRKIRKIALTLNLDG